MRGLNKVELIGNLGADPELRYTQGGTSVANMRVATNYTKTDRHSGEKTEHAEWHRCVVFGKLAEIVGEYLHKGSPVYLAGRLQTRKYTKDGVDHYPTEVIVEDLIMLPNGNGGNGSNGSGRASAPASAPAGDPDIDDDIPF